MSTPNESQLKAALEIIREKGKIQKEIDRLEKELAATREKLAKVDERVLKALGVEGTPAEKPAKAKAPRKPQEKKATKAPASATSGSEPTPEPSPTPSPTPTPTKKVRTAKPSQEKGDGAAPSGRGKLGEQIIEILKKKPEGVHANELATLTGRKPANIYVWRSNIGKKIKGLSVKDGIFSFQESTDSATEADTAE